MIIKQVAKTIPLIAVGWLATLVIVGLVSDDAPAQIVLFPSANFMNNLPVNASILDHSDWRVVLQSESNGFAKALYQHGAKLVLPSGLDGCLRF